MTNKPLDPKQTLLINRYHPSAFLLAAQLLLLILYILFGDTREMPILFNAVSIAVLILVMWVINRSPAADWVAWVLAVPAFILSILSITDAFPELLKWSSIISGVLYFYTAGSLIAYMMKDYKVTVDELFATGATFTLLAWGFAYFYLAAQAWLPDSFLSSIHPDRAMDFIELLSLSFTNLTATGLSDIVPVSIPARVLVMLEQFVGIGYVAMVVSRLVGLTIGGKK